MYLKAERKDPSLAMNVKALKRTQGGWNEEGNKGGNTVTQVFFLSKSKKQGLLTF